MELGISPIVSAGMIIQLLTGLQILQCDTSLNEDRELIDTASKCISFFYFINLLQNFELYTIS